LQEGQFVAQIPAHPYFLDGEAAATTSLVQMITDTGRLEEISVTRTLRKELLTSYLQFYALHVADFGTLRSWQVIQDILQ
jgi:DNA repair protein RecO (recombination protein O)